MILTKENKDGYFNYPGHLVDGSDPTDMNKCVILETTNKYHSQGPSYVVIDFGKQMYIRGVTLHNGPEPYTGKFTLKSIYK